MNLNAYIKMAYENKSNWTLGENKPNSNPIKPNFTYPQSGKTEVRILKMLSEEKNITHIAELHVHYTGCYFLVIYIESDILVNAEFLTVYNCSIVVICTGQTGETDIENRCLG